MSTDLHYPVCSFLHFQCREATSHVLRTSWYTVNLPANHLMISSLFSCFLKVNGYFAFGFHELNVPSVLPELEDGWAVVLTLCSERIMGTWVVTNIQDCFLMSYAIDSHSIWLTVLVIQNLMELKKKHCKRDEIVTSKDARLLQNEKRRQFCYN